MNKYVFLYVYVWLCEFVVCVHGWLHLHAFVKETYWGLTECVGAERCSEQTARGLLPPDAAFVNY